MVASFIAMWAQLAEPVQPTRLKLKIRKILLSLPLTQLSLHLNYHNINTGHSDEQQVGKRRENFPIKLRENQISKFGPRAYPKKQEHRTVTVQSLDYNQM